MSQRVYLTEEDRGVCWSVTEALCAIHGQTRAKLLQTYVGIVSEFAAVKFFNQCMGAKQQIDFRTVYNERGGDGGFDFISCGMKWDVKYSRSGKVPADRLKKSTADMILVCNKISPAFGNMSVNIFGCYPRLRALRYLSEGNEQEAYKPLSMPQIFRAFQSEFGAQWSKLSKPSGGLSRIGDITGRLLGDIA